MAGDRITITFPNVPEFLRLARLTSADAGTRAGFDFEEVDDLRIAVSELCGLMMTGDHTPLTLEFGFDGDGLTVEGRLAGPASAPGDLTQAIVAALVDEHDLELGEARSSFRIRKTSRQP